MSRAVAAHRVVVRRADARAHEHVVLDDRERSQVDARLHAHAVADAHVVVDHAAAADQAAPRRSPTRSRTKDWSPRIAPAAMLAPANTTAPAPTRDPLAELPAGRPRRARRSSAPGAGACRARRDPRSRIRSPITVPAWTTTCAPNLTPSPTRTPSPSTAARAVPGAQRRAPCSQPHHVRAPRGARDAAQVDDLPRAPRDRLVVDAGWAVTMSTRSASGEPLVQGPLSRSNSASAGTCGSW